MDSRDPLFLYKETRLNLEPPPSTVVHIHVTSPAGSNGRQTQKRLNGSDKFAEEERAYRSKALASASAVFYRRYHSTPKAFLWRILEGGSVLSLRAVDISRLEKAPDTPLSLYIHFPAPLKPGCVAFADPKNLDALNVFAIDESNHIHSLLLRPDVFRKRSAADSADKGRPFLPTAFSFKHVHRLLAVNPNQLLATLHDGGILVFDKNHAHDAPASWKETFYNSSGWKQGLRNLLPFQSGPTVRYGKANMELTTATSVTVTSMDMVEASFIFTVCLDHRLRIWNRSGSILYTGDILNTERNPQEVGKWTIDPSQANLVKVLEVSEAQCLCVTYSPIGAGAFKLWKVAASSAESIIVKDAFPELQLVAPAPSSSDIWTMADFGLSQTTTRALQLWVLWKNNLTYRVRKVEFTPDVLETAWANDWVDVFAEGPTPPAQTSNPCDPTAATEKWLRLIFAPGRFTRSTLETALGMYEGGVGSSKESSSRGSKSLAESICTVLGSTASLERDSTGGVDYEQFRSTSEVHWRRFYRLLIELDKQRGEALSLAVDPVSGLTWVVCADCVSAIRECGTLDRVHHNLGSPEAKYQSISALLTAGSGFLDGFSDSMLQLSGAALRAELFDDSSKTDYERIQFFSDKSGFWRQVTDEDCVQVVEALGENFRLVTLALYRDLLSLVGETEDGRTRDVRDPLTDFGRKLVVKGTQEVAELQWRVLFGQVVLLVHMVNELDGEESALHRRFDIGAVYRQLMAALRRLELVRWLARNEINVPLFKRERRPSAAAPPAHPHSQQQQQPALSASFASSVPSPASAKRGGGGGGAAGSTGVEDMQAITTLEASIGHLLGLSELDAKPLAATLTDVIVGICAPDSSIEMSVAIIQCFLLKRDRPDLALELGVFADRDAFSTYVQGRVCLALRDYDSAMIHFKRAAIGLSVQMKNAERHSVGLLDETEWNLLNSGLPNYYSHIVALYEKQKAYSYVVEFARLSLQFIRAGSGSGSASLGGGHATQPPNGGAAAASSIRMDMLNRLFAASTAISRFDLAHGALLAMGPDPALQQNCLRRLVEKMCETRQNAELVRLPFCELRSSVDRILELKCRSVPPGSVSGSAAGPGPVPVPYHQILYAWRVHHGDYKGAAAVLLDRARKLRRAGEGDRLVGDDVLDTPVTRQYLMLINALSCVEPKQAWIVTEEEVVGGGGAVEEKNREFEELLEGLGAGGGGGGNATGNSVADGLKALAALGPGGNKGQPGQKGGGSGVDTWRRVRSLADLRREYQDELDRITAIQNNQFEFSLGEEDDIMDES